MKRKQAVMFFGVLALSNAVWFTWCARPFFVSAPVVYDAGLPEEVRDLAEVWLGDHPEFGQRGFTMDRYLGYLCHPSTVVIDPIEVGFWAGCEDIVTIGRKGEKTVMGYHRSRFNGSLHGPTFH